MAFESKAGGALISAFLDDALEMLDSTDVLDYFQDKNIDVILRDKLRDSLLSIKLVMDDAENKHYSNKDVSKWLHKVRDVVHDAEDLLDEIHTEASKSKLLEAEFYTTTTATMSKISTSSLTSSSVSSFDKELQSRMKDILHNLESLERTKDRLGLEKSSDCGVGAVLGKKISQRLQTTSLLDESTLCGRDDDKKVIIDLLLSDNYNGTGGNNLTVICIVGMGGMGKTTLAQLVYNDSSMDEFQLKAWVCVSEDFDLAMVTRTILEGFTLSTEDTKGLNLLQVKLKEKLTGKKFLIVLDDVWEEKNKKWEALRAPLLYGARGSKILVTSRSEKVASTMRCAHLYQLKQLSEEKSWLLFATHALSHTNSTSNFEGIGRKIIKKCNGLPLALKAIGSLLYDNSSYEEWNRILTSQMWDISDDGCDIIPALILSYQFLPSPLKRCFAYCSLIPKDCQFDKDWLVDLWMAENFLQVHQQNKGMKELGDQFFNDLLSRSFFQRSRSFFKRSTSKKQLFFMHDLVNDLATYVSREFCLRLEEEKEAKNVSKMTRHISNLENYEEGSEQFDAIYKGNKLRTFLHCRRCITSVEMVDDLLCKYKCLRALSLYLSYHVFMLPDSIGNLKHLRYLDLSFSGLRKLPNSTCLLYNLQTMKLKNCRYLEELPSEMHKLVNLCHLDFRGTMVRKLPSGMGKLKKLEVLSSFYVGKCNEVNINQLGELRLRGTLSIEELQNVTDPMDASAASLKNKIHLEQLWLRWESSRGMKLDGYEIEEDVLEKLQPLANLKELSILEKLQPPANLKELSIEYYGGTRFPDWLGDMSTNNNIVKLKLIGCKYCVALPPLGMLPSLEVLSIDGLEGIKSIGGEFYGMGNNSSSSCAAAAPPFRSLQFLGFVGMKGWEEWDCKNASSSSGTGAAFPCLVELIIRECPQLKNKLPPLNLFPKLQRLRLEKCSNLERLDVGSGCIGAVTSSSSLEDLGIENCPKLVSFPFTLFPSLVKLSLWVCPQLEWPKEGSGGFPSSLKEFEIGNCPGLLACQNKWDLHACTSLTDLRIQDESFEFVDYKGGLLPPNLKKLNYKEVVPSSL